MITNSNKTIILSIHSHFDNEFTNIIDSKNDTTNLANIIYKNLKKENIKVIEPTIKLLPANWDQDYYYIQREININPTIILNCFFVSSFATIFLLFSEFEIIVYDVFSIVNTKAKNVILHFCYKKIKPENSSFIKIILHTHYFFFFCFYHTIYLCHFFVC